MAKDKKSVKVIKKAETVRERAAKTSKKARAGRIRRIKGGAGKLKAPIERVWQAGHQPYHVIPQKQSGFWGFMTKTRRFTPTYFINSWRELRQVTWPNRRTTWKLVMAVFIFAFFFGTIIALVDFGLDKVFKQLLLR